MADWEDEKFNEVFDNVYATTKYRRLLDPGFSVRDLESLLETLYVSDGNDQGGRGRVGDIISAATIAAHEQVLAEWKNDETGGWR
ncbi:MAG: hypothetical protein LBK44_07525 [Spirochaetales bacterium]|jgi:hypothetical protein|nr:hypothetical protein [Spirochaetales bacterium]